MIQQEKKKSYKKNLDDFLGHGAHFISLFNMHTH